MRIKLSILAILLLTAYPAFAQDLGQLRPRALKLWELRQQGKKLDALPLVEPKTREIYLQRNEAPILSFRIAALEFTDDLAQMNVVVRVHTLIGPIGEIDATVREMWVWEDGEWFMQATSVPNPFKSDPSTVTEGSEQPPDLKIANSTIDAGRHTQGDLIEGRIPFQADRAEIAAIRPLENIPGLAVGGATWTGPMGGYLPYHWETTLLSQDVDKSIALEATGTNDKRTTVAVRFRVRIDGKIAFRQIPELVDPTQAGQVELQIQNLTGKPIKVLSVVSNNPIYTINDDVTELIEAGKSGHIGIKYPAQSQAAGASLNLVLSENLTASSVTTVPLNVKLPDEKPAATTTREELDRIISKARGTIR